MGKQKLCLGLLIGTIAGGLLSLLDRDARSYAKGKMSDVKNGSSYYIKRPSEAVKGVKDAFGRFNTQFTNGADNAINALEQVENTLDQFTNKSDREELNNNL
ncbi:YtxH domain-containing protein [Lentibacillus salicampi]|uniref:YtxH domain-containing protein n=1 Tax=Lentibacillus salicampi TaxID=175306 RepID=A0A4Y9AAG5_9BACI|nr:YtxH domain-containing protein [Lentibacillus salicampi]TFJ91354.1 YtxH domain-containing protein [Lentibacillus salicampi]